MKGKYRIGEVQSIKKMARQSTCNDEEKKQIPNVQNSTTFRWILFFKIVYNNKYDIILVLFFFF